MRYDAGFMAYTEPAFTASLCAARGAHGMGGATTQAIHARRYGHGLIEEAG